MSEDFIPWTRWACEICEVYWSGTDELCWCCGLLGISYSRITHERKIYETVQ